MSWASPEVYLFKDGYRRESGAWIPSGRGPLGIASLRGIVQAGQPAF